MYTVVNIGDVWVCFALTIRMLYAYCVFQYYVKHKECECPTVF